MQYLHAISKMTEMILIPFQGKPFNIPVIQVYAPATDVKEAEVGLGVQNEAGQRLTEFCLL